MNRDDALYPTLKGKTVLVTGGGSGIGESIVEHFSAQGARVTFADIQEDASRALVERIRERGYAAPRFVRCDLKQIDALRDAIDRVGREDGPIKVLVNNAANDDRHRIENVSVDYWDDRIAGKSASSILCRTSGSSTDARFRRRLDHQSRLGQLDDRRGGLHRLCHRQVGRQRADARPRPRTRAGEYPRQLRRAGLGDDQAATRALGDAGRRETDRRAPVPEGRLYPPDIARMVLWLASDDSRMCTSQNFIVDAGWV